MAENINESVVGKFYEQVVLNIENGPKDNNYELWDQVDFLLQTIEEQNASPKAFMKNILSSEDLSEAEKRICVLLSALNSGKGITEVSDILDKLDMQPFYVRYLFEFVLHYCFCANETGGGCYNVKKFNKLYNKCSKMVQKILSENKTAFETNDKNPTIRDLDELVCKNTEIAADGLLGVTNNVTEKILFSLNEIEKTKDMAEADVLALAKKYASQFAESCAITRYYFCRYVSLVAKVQFYEFKSILLDFTGLTVCEALEKYKQYKDDETVSPLSLRKVFSENIKAGYLEKETDFSKSTQIRKDLLECLVRSTMFFGSNKNATSSLLANEIVKTNLSWFENNILIFKDENNEVSKLRSAVEALDISDFYDYKISSSSLYMLLFERTILLECDVAPDLAEDFIKGVLKGRCDLSRNAFMFFLSNVNQILKDSSAALEELGKDFRKKDILNSRRYQDIIIRCHFYPLGKFSEDGLYYTNLELPTKYFDRWRKNIMTLDFDGIPYEIAYISSAGIRKVKSTYKGVI